MFKIRQGVSSGEFSSGVGDALGGLFGGGQNSIVGQVLGSAFNNALGSISQGRKINSRGILRSGSNQVGKYIGQEISKSWSDNSQNTGFRFSRSQADTEASLELRRSN